jgi:hypothetical protein
MIDLILYFCIVFIICILVVHKRAIDKLQTEVKFFRGYLVAMDEDISDIERRVKND